LTGQSIRYRRLRKRWLYVGVYGPDVMVCAARVAIGPAGQAFWGVWDRRAGALREHTRFARAGRIAVDTGGVAVDDGDVAIDLRLEPAGAPWAVRCPAGAAWTWTRKTPVRARGTVRIAGVARPVDAAGLIHESDGFHPRHTAWRWSAGVGRAEDGRAVAWNLVAGLNDPAAGSERAVWADGVPAEAPPADFADDLSAVSFPGGETLTFAEEARRARRDELGIVASDYEQPFGTFSGELPGGVRLAEGFGVMERHVARW
jgi:Protein of unknown function (DUF2804)